MGIQQAFFRSRDPILYLQAENIASVQSSGTATAGFVLTNFNDAQERAQATYTTRFAWLTGGSAANYEARWTNISGTLSAGTAGTWQALSSTLEYNVQKSVLGVKACQGTIEIGLLGTSTALVSATIDLSAEIA